MHKFFVLVVCLLAVSAAAQESVSEAVVAERTAHLLESMAVQPQTHECVFHTTLGCNTTVNETINIFGCVTSDGLTYFNAYRFFVNTNTTITIQFKIGSYTPLVLLTDDAVTTTLASTVGTAGSTAKITYTTKNSAYYLLAVSAVEPF